MPDAELTYLQFLADERAFCVWAPDIKEDCLRFLVEFDSGYFGLLADFLAEGLNRPAHHHVALLARQMYAQSLETLFALLGALLQAPKAVHAYLHCYPLGAIPSLVEKVLDGRPIRCGFGYVAVSWSQVSELVHAHAPWSEGTVETVESFAELWRRFSADYLEASLQDDYRSIKHGSRIQARGIRISFQPTKAPEAGWHQLGEADYASQRLERIDLPKLADVNHVRFGYVTNAWNPECQIAGLRLVAQSLQNIVACLRILNGVEVDKVSFARPDNDETFLLPWAHGLTFKSFSHRTWLSDEAAQAFNENPPNMTAADIREMYENWNTATEPNDDE